MNSGILTKVICILCFVTIMLSLLSVVFFFYGEIDSELLARIVVLIELMVVILHKVYTLISEKRVLGDRLSAKLRKQSFIKHNNVFFSITTEIDRIFFVGCLLLGITFVSLSLISGYLIKLLAVYILTLVVLFLSKTILFYKSVGKILDYESQGGNSSFIRGYAKLFLLEYHTTGFRRNHSIYKNHVYRAYRECNIKQDACIKSILYFEVKYQIKHERAKWMMVLGCMVINAIVLFYNKTDWYISDTVSYYHLSFLSGIPVKIIVVSILNTLMCLISTGTLLRYHYTCNYVKKILSNLTNDNAEERFEAYKRIDKKKSDYKKIRGLGLLTVCVDRGYESNNFFDKDLLYLPLLRHHLRMPIKDFVIYLIAIVSSLLMLFINRLGIFGIIILTGCTLCGLSVLYFLVIPITKKAVIKYYCKKLNENIY